MVKFAVGVLVEKASDDFPQQRKLENLLPNFAGSSPPISPKTSPTSLWKSLLLRFWNTNPPCCTNSVLCEGLGGFGLWVGNLHAQCNQPGHLLLDCFCCEVAAGLHLPHWSNTPWFSFPCFLGFPSFFCCKECPCFFERFSLLSQGLEGFNIEKKSLLLGVVFLAFSK